MQHEAGLPFERWRHLMWFAWAGFWLLMILVSLQDNYWSGQEPLWRPLLWEGSSALVSTALISIQFFWLPKLRPLLNRPLRWFARQLVFLPLVVLAFVAITYSIRHGVYHLLNDVYQHDPWPQVLLYESLKVAIFFSLWTAAQFGVESFIALFKSQQQNFAMERALADARRALLQAKIQPHFLFNSLNTISAVMHEDVDKAEQLISDLSMLLREGLALDQKSFVELREEWLFVQAYSHLMLARFAPRVTMSWQLDESVADVQVPPLILQPLLENMFRHGAEKIPGAFHISISAQRIDDDLCLVVESHQAELAVSWRDGEGMHQVRERLRLSFGDNAELIMQKREPKGVEVRVRIREVFADA